MTAQKAKKIIARTLLILLPLCILGVVAVFGINGYVVHTTKDRILTPEQAATLTDVDCILVLGCGVNADGQPSAMLADRLIRGISLYQNGAAPKLLMSGDHGRATYDEVNVMKQYAMDRDVPSEDVFMDHAGFSTYESIYRAKEIFGVEKIIIVTQGYHLHRALYIAEAFDLEAYGVAADYRPYSGQLNRDIREILARNKDFVTSIYKPLPTHLGETIPIFGDGNLTNG